LKSIEELSTALYEEVLRLYNSQGEWNRKAFSEILDEKLANYNNAVSPLIMSGVYSNLNSAFTSDALPSVILTEPKLSKMLFNNAQKVSGEAIGILNAGISAKRPIGQIAKKLYDGYGFNDREVLDIRKKLPLYLKQELKKDKISKEFLKYVDNIKTKPLKIALKELTSKLDSVDSKGFKNALKVVLEEKSRFYANE